MKETILHENVEKKLSLSFRSVRNDMEILKKQILIAQEINAVSPSYTELKKEINADINRSLLEYEQKMNLKLNEELKKQNEELKKQNILLQQIFEKIKLKEQHEKVQQKQLAEKFSEGLEENSSSVKELKQQFIRIKKQQDILLNDSVDLDHVEKSFMTKEKIITFLHKNYDQNVKKNILQIYDKISDLRHDFDEISVHNNNFYKKVKTMQESIDSGEIISKLKTAVKKITDENNQLKHKQDNLEKDIFSLHHRKHKEVDIDMMLNDIAKLKQNSMTKDDVQHMLDAFSKKINVMREELDDFERNLDTVNMKTKQFHV